MRGINEGEANELFSGYHEGGPVVKGIEDWASEQAEKAGHIRTWLGRKCRFNMWEPKSFGYNRPLPLEEAAKEYGGKGRIRRAFTYKALNRLIQASAADMTKQAMVNIYESGRVPMIQIHDEIAMSVKNREDAESIATIMENAVPLEVPSKCDVEIGPSWGEAT